MKRIIVMTVVLISIPFFVVLLTYDDNIVNVDKIKLKYNSNVIVRVKRVNLDRIDSVELEDYVVGVVAGEMPASFDIEAMKAQAVASRSYVLAKMENNGGSYDVVDTTSNQVYLDDDDMKKKWGSSYVSYLNKVKEAVDDTSKEYLEYDGKVANTMFFSTSNGYTEDSVMVFSEDVPYLRSVESSWDSEVNSNFTYSIEMPISEFYQKLDLDYNDSLDVKILKKSSSGRIINLSINSKKFTGREVYSKLGIRSTDFTITQDNDIVKIVTRGFGHGVGMSQYGALGMAREGYNYKEILEHYYKGTVLKKL